MPLVTKILPSDRYGRLDKTIYRRSVDNTFSYLAMVPLFYTATTRIATITHQLIVIFNLKMCLFC